MRPNGFLASVSVSLFLSFFSFVLVSPRDRIHDIIRNQLGPVDLEKNLILFRLSSLD